MVSGSDCIASSGRVINEHLIGKEVEGNSGGPVSPTLAWGMRKATKLLGQNCPFHWQGGTYVYTSAPSFVIW